MFTPWARKERERSNTAVKAFWRERRGGQLSPGRQGGRAAVGHRVKDIDGEGSSGEGAFGIDQGGCERVFPLGGTYILRQRETERDFGGVYSKLSRPVPDTAPPAGATLYSVFYPRFLPSMPTDSPNTPGARFTLRCNSRFDRCPFIVFHQHRDNERSKMQCANNLTQHSLTQNSPVYLEWYLAKEKLEGFFPLKYAILSYGEMPFYLSI